MIEGPEGDLYIYGSYSTEVQFREANDFFRISNGETFGGSFIVRLSKSGELRWAISLGHDTRAGGISIGPEGTIYVAGSFEEEGDFDPGADEVMLTPAFGNSDLYLAAYTDEGAYLWSSQRSSQFAGFTSYVATDELGGIYWVYGYSQELQFDDGRPNRTSVDSNETLIEKFTPEGSSQWLQELGSAVGNQPAGATYRNGFLYVSGFFPALSPATAADDNGYVVVRLDTEGTVIWVASHELGGSLITYDLEVDEFSNVYVAGLLATLTPEVPGGLLLSRFRPSGKLAWNLVVNSNDFLNARAVSVDATGRFYLTGEYNSRVTVTDQLQLFHQSESELYLIGGSDPGIPLVTSVNRTTPDSEVIAIPSGTVSGQYALRFTGQPFSGTITCYDALGHVYQTTAHQGSAELIYQTPAAKGLYLLKLIDEAGKAHTLKVLHE